MRGLIALFICYLNVHFSSCQIQPHFNPRATIEFFCPCEEFKDCRTVLGHGDFGPIFHNIAQSIPQCRERDEVRCCSRDMMFTAVTIIMNANAARNQLTRHTGQQQPQFTAGSTFQQPQGAIQQPLSSNLHSHSTVPLQQHQPPTFHQHSSGFDIGGNSRDADRLGSGSQGLFFGHSEEIRSLPPGITCVPHVRCPPANRYSSDPSYVSRFGTVSPSICPVSSGNTLCVEDIVDRSQSTQSRLPDLLDRSRFQPSGHSAEEDGRILNLLGQLTEGPGRSNLPAEVQCVPMVQCRLVNIYGTNPSHFRRYGVINPSTARCLASSGNILCVSDTQTGHQQPEVSDVDLPVNLPDSVPEIPSRPFGGPTTPTRRPLVGPEAPSVSIVGPQPIYVSYNNVKGPSVGGDNGLESVGHVSADGVDSSQQHQIDTLLSNLKNRLRSIIQG